MADCTPMSSSLLPEATDNNTLYIYSDTATAQQVQDAIVTALTEYQKTVTGFPYELHINRVENRDYQPMGYCLAYISNSIGFHLLLGHNPDGTERFEECNDRLIKLPPLVNVPPVELNNGPYNLTFKAAAAPTLNFGVHMTNILRCDKVPQWLSEHTLLSKISHIKQGGGYPRVCIDRAKRMAYIMYKSGTDDARMALFMIRKVKIVQHRERGRIDEVTLMFGHALKKEAGDIKKYKFVS